MTPPRVCPQPSHQDCPLYDQRIARQRGDEALRRAMLRDQSRASPSLADLIRQDALNQAAEEAEVPPPAAQLPAPEPVPPLPLPIDHRTKGRTP